MISGKYVFSLYNLLLILAELSLKISSSFWMLVQFDRLKQGYEYRYEEAIDNM